MEKKYKKKMLEIPINYYIDWCYCDLDNVEDDIKNLKKLGANTLDIGVDAYESVYIKAYCCRKETDEEVRERIKQDKIVEENKKAKELMLLQELKAKYEA